MTPEMKVKCAGPCPLAVTALHSEKCSLCQGTNMIEQWVTLPELYRAMMTQAYSHTYPHKED